MANTTVANTTVANTTVANVSCDCPVPLIADLQSAGLVYSNILCVLAIVSNLLTILMLARRVQNKSTTENLLLIITIADLTLPIVSLARDTYVAIYEFEIFIVYLSYMWFVFYGVTVLLTLLLAIRHFIAIEYPHAYNFLKRGTTRNLTFAIFMFCSISLLPVCLIRLPPQGCDDLHMTKDILNMTINISMVNQRVGRRLLRFTYHLYEVVFQILCPITLAGLSLKFVMVMEKLFTMNRQSLINETKMIYFLSMIVVARDLPHHFLTDLRHVFRLQTGCVSSLRSWATGLTILMSSLNLLVLYSTNEKFKAAVPSWARRTSYVELHAAATLARLRRQPGF